VLVTGIILATSQRIGGGFSHAVFQFENPVAHEIEACASYHIEKQK
jgi:hypothetical protein